MSLRAPLTQEAESALSIVACASPLAGKGMFSVAAAFCRDTTSYTAPLVPSAARAATFGWETAESDKALPFEIYSMYTSAPMTQIHEEEQFGIQWRSVGSIAALFAGSWALAFMLDGASLAWMDRARNALQSAAIILVCTASAMWGLAKVIHHSRLSSRLLFAAVWMLILVAWYVIRQR